MCLTFDQHVHYNKLSSRKERFFFVGGGGEGGRVSLTGLGDELHSKLMKTPVLIKFGMILYYVR